MRKSPGSPLAKWDDNLDLSRSDSIYTITLVTPMFGGGYKAGQIDSERFIRESSIRGQLRFWWRATRGARFKDVSELRKREVEIFGDTNTPSNVKVFVDIQEKEVWPISAPQVRIPKYALYSVGPEVEEAKREAELKTLGCTFKLHIYYTTPELKDEVEAALWAWINFGGLGSRTRRGCGSLYCVDFSPSREEAALNYFSKWFDTKIKSYGIPILKVGDSREWPTLSNRIKVRTHTSKMKQNWDEVIEAYKKFRRRANERTGSSRPGRSFWPEADSIRAITRLAHPDHKHPFPEDKPRTLCAFPRASLGLPIIFEFKKKTSREDKLSPIEYRDLASARKRWEREPDSTQLVPVSKERLASPIILKPLAYSVTESIGVIAVLNHPPLKEVILKLGKKELGPFKVGHNVSYSKNPLQDSRNFYSSAVDAFLNSEEVERFCRTTNMKKSQSQRAESQNHTKRRY